MKPLRTHQTIYLIFLFSLYSVAGYGQTETRTLNGWIFSSHEQKLSQKWALLSDVQVRSAHRLTYIEALLLRPALQYSLNDKHSVAAGYAFLGNWEKDGGKTVYEPEHRIWEQYNCKTKWGNREMNNRVRFEQRFLEKNGSNVFAQRLRHYIRLQIPFAGGTEFKKGVYAALQNELFLNVQNKANVNNNFFDQNRAYGVIGYRISEAVDAEIGYLYRYQIEDERMHNHILQLQLSTSL